MLIERLEREEINTVEELARHTEKLKEEMERVYHVYNKLTSLLDDSKQPKASEEEFKHLYRDVLE